MSIVPSSRLPSITPERMKQLAFRGWAHEWLIRQRSQCTRGRRPGVTFCEKTVTEEYLFWVYHSQQKRCAITGREMIIPNWRIQGEGSTVRAPRNAHNISVDRIDSKRGYVAGNIQLVCYAVNVMKMEMDNSTFVSWCRDVIKTADGH